MWWVFWGTIAAGAAGIAAWYFLKDTPVSLLGEIVIRFIKASRNAVAAKQRAEKRDLFEHRRRRSRPSNEADSITISEDAEGESCSDSSLSPSSPLCKRLKVGTSECLEAAFGTTPVESQDRLTVFSPFRGDSTQISDGVAAKLAVPRHAGGSPTQESDIAAPDQASDCAGRSGPNSAENRKPKECTPMDGKDSVSKPASSISSGNTSDSSFELLNRPSDSEFTVTKEGAFLSSVGGSSSRVEDHIGSQLFRRVTGSILGRTRALVFGAATDGKSDAMIPISRQLSKDNLARAVPACGAAEKKGLISETQDHSACKPSPGTIHFGRATKNPQPASPPVGVPSCRDDKSRKTDSTEGAGNSSPSPGVNETSAFRSVSSTSETSEIQTIVADNSTVELPAAGMSVSPNEAEDSDAPSLGQSYSRASKPALGAEASFNANQRNPVDAEGSSSPHTSSEDAQSSEYLPEVSESAESGNESVRDLASDQGEAILQKVQGDLLGADSTSAPDTQSSGDKLLSTETSHLMKSEKMEKVDLLEAVEKLKKEGNEAFSAGSYDRAIEMYTEALLKSPEEDCDNVISILLANRAACYLALQRYDEASRDCEESLELNPQYVKAYLRRFRAHEATEKWHEALADINKALELDPSLKVSYGAMQKKVEKLSQEQFEKEKEEMLGKLKEFGNWALGKVGLSLDNFKVEQNADTGSYNIQFKQNEC